MRMSGEQRIAAPRQRVWEALNDPDVLRAAIPGCQSLEKEGDDSFTATVEVRIGPIGARFKGAVELADLDPPNGYTLNGEGNAGIAGSARGSARVRLGDDGAGGTLLSYDVNAQVAGRLAQLGGPLIDATAKRIAETFFSRFNEVVSGPAATASPGVGSPAPASDGLLASGAPASASAAAGPQISPVTAPGMPWGWIAAIVLAVVVGFTMGRSGFGGGLLTLVLILLIVATAAAYEAGRRAAGR